VFATILYIIFISSNKRYTDIPSIYNYCPLHEFVEEWTGLVKVMIMKEGSVVICSEKKKSNKITGLGESRD